MNTLATTCTPQNALQSVSNGSEEIGIKRSNRAGAPTGRRSRWSGKKLPEYPDDGTYYRRPTTTQIVNAFTAPRPEHWVNIWLRRLAILNPARYSALRSAFADRGKAGLHACRFTSMKPCRQCGGSERYAVQNQCTRCNQSVRYGKPAKATEQKLIERAQKQQAKASAEHGTTELAGFQDGWMFKLEGTRVLIVHPVKTHGKPVLLDADRIGQNAIDSQFRSLYQWACHNRALPDGALYQAL